MATMGLVAEKRRLWLKEFSKEHGLESRCSGVMTNRRINQVYISNYKEGVICQRRMVTDVVEGLSDELGAQTQDLGWYREDRRLRCCRRDVRWRLS